MLSILAVLGMLWPLIAKAITTDEQTYYPQSGDVHSIALESDGIVNMSSSTEPTGGFSHTRIAAPRQVAASVLPVLDRIAFCESKNIPTAKNPGSSASGRFQLIHSTWIAYATMLWGSPEGHDVFNYEDNTAVARLLYEKEGVKPWTESSPCWSK